MKSDNTAPFLARSAISTEKQNWQWFCTVKDREAYSRA